MLDGGAHFYSVYYSTDNQGFAVACIEPLFFRDFVSRLPIDESEKKSMLDNQFNMDLWPAAKERLA